MKKINNQSGFTLIEIIVVLIIVGVLASIALPNLFANIQKSKAGQAITMIDSLKTNMEACLTSNSGIAAGTSPCTQASYLTPSNGNGWTYTIGGAQAQTANLGTSVAASGSYAGGNLTYSLVATDALSTPSSISFTRATSGSWTCSTGSSSPYLGVC